MCKRLDERKTRNHRRFCFNSLKFGGVPLLFSSISYLYCLNRVVLPMQQLNNTKRVVLVHVSFWCLYLSFFTYQVSLFVQGPDIDWNRLITVVSIHITCAMLIGYLNYFIFLPQLLSKKQPLQFFLQFIAAFVIVVLIRIHAERFLIDHYSHEHKYLYSPRFIVHVISSHLFTVIFLGMIRFVTEWFEFEARKKSVENEKLTAELNFLKAQINPHFLFNTLNNLYYLAYMKSPNTPEVIAKLSQMMR